MLGGKTHVLSRDVPAACSHLKGIPCCDASTLADGWFQLHLRCRATTVVAGTRIAIAPIASLALSNYNGGNLIMSRATLIRRHTLLAITLVAASLARLSREYTRGILSGLCVRRF